MMQNKTSKCPECKGTGEVEKGFTMKMVNAKATAVALLEDCPKCYKAGFLIDSPDKLEK